MEHQPPDDVVIQVNAAAVAAVDERSLTDEEAAAELQVAGSAGDDRGLTRRAFSQAYKMKHRKPMEFTTLQMLLLSYQLLGIVYGDLGTSPLYLFSSITLPDPREEDFVGILSIILWTLTSISLIKYIFVVLHADDHGEGND